VFLLNPEKNWHTSVLSFSRKTHSNSEKMSPSRRPGLF